MTTYRLWPATSGPANGTADATAYTLGVEFEISAPAELAGYFVWTASDQDTGARSFRLYSVDAGGLTGSAVAGSDVTSGVLTAGQWNYVPLAAPIALTAGQRYRACQLVPAVAVPYSSTGLYWSTGPGSAGITNGILTAPRRADAEGLLQGQFNVGAVMTFPANEFNATNYWVDVLVDDGAGPADAGASMMWED